MRLSRCVINRPSKKSSVCCTTLYEDDLAYLKEHGIPLARAVRLALHEYVIIQKDLQKGKPNFEKMTREERFAWVLSAPRGDSVEPGDLQILGEEVLRSIPHEPVPDMTGWTRDERGAWILDGVIPDRVMMVRKTGARI